MSKSFAEIIGALADGELEARATKLLTELSAAVELTGGDGRLVLTLKIVKQNRMAVIRPSIKITRPEPAVDDTMFFVDEDGSLVRDDPKQLRLPKTERLPRVVPISSGTKKTDDNGGD